MRARATCVWIKNILVSEEALKAKVAELGAQISRDYEGRNLVLVSMDIIANMFHQSLRVIALKKLLSF